MKEQREIHAGDMCVACGVTVRADDPGSVELEAGRLRRGPATATAD